MQTIILRETGMVDQTANVIRPAIEFNNPSTLYVYHVTKDTEDERVAAVVIASSSVKALELTFTKAEIDIELGYMNVSVIGIAVAGSSPCVVIKSIN